MNVLKTTFLMAVLTVLLMWLGNLLAGRQGMWMFLILAGAMNFFAYWFSDKMVLKMYHAQPITESEGPEIYAIVRKLAQAANMPMPKVYLVPSESPNAFATGRDPQHAVVAVTQGIMRLLDRDELEGVLAHELAHVRNRDTLVSAVVATLAGAITLLSRSAMFFGGGRRNGERGSNPIAMLLALILAPIAALLVQAAISRTREYGADRTGSTETHKPLALASALKKLERGTEVLPMSMATESTAHQFIVNPLRGGLSGLFSTHPKTADRVARLEELARSLGQRP
jgi:heat shock protein HtpX